MKHLPTPHQRAPAAMARRGRTIPRTRRAQAGVSLVEALVAFLVTAFGMLSIAGMQASLSRNSDTAKQRSEAVRLAQQKMEQLRSFDAITGGNYSYGVDVVSDATEAGIAPAASNTTFTRTWTVTKDDGATANVASWVRFKSRRVEGRSTVTAVSGTCPALAFTVGGVVRVVTDASTRFEHGTCASLTVGTKVRVKGDMKTDDGEVIAEEVEIESRPGGSR